jgi:hypothetical protein
MVFIHYQRADDALGQFRVMKFQPRNKLVRFAARAGAGAHCHAARN